MPVDLLGIILGAFIGLLAFDRATAIGIGNPKAIAFVVAVLAAVAIHFAIRKLRSMKAKGETPYEKHKRLMREHRFFSRDRANFWRMPHWIRIPVVCSLILLFALAIASIAWWHSDA